VAVGCLEEVLASFYLAVVERDINAMPSAAVSRPAKSTSFAGEGYRADGFLDAVPVDLNAAIRFTGVPWRCVKDIPTTLD
jgi:hypothetical protein